LRGATYTWQQQRIHSANALSTTRSHLNPALGVLVGGFGSANPDGIDQDFKQKTTKGNKDPIAPKAEQLRSSLPF
jgi:hypothetical protein